MVSKRVGIIVVPPGVIIERNEKLTADFLAARLSMDVTFLVPNRTIGQKTPDIEMDGVLWEIKVPRGKGSRTIENTIRRAVKQSPNVVIDLRCMDGRIPTGRHLIEIERQFMKNRSIKRALVITRQEGVIDLGR